MDRSNFAARAARWSAEHWKSAVAAWGSKEAMMATTAPVVPRAASPHDVAPKAPDDGSDTPRTRLRGHIGWAVAASLVSGLVVGLLLVAAPFISAEESNVTGALLCGFALGWAMLAVLTVRFSDQPQRWAAAPALFMGLGGLLLVGFGSGVQEVLRWMWPPALLALVVWMIVRAHRQLRSRSRRWLLYPVIAMMALAAVGGGYETVRGALDEDFSMPGQLIDVGGHSLHLNCRGSGSPTVILEPGAGGMSSDLAWITPAVARDTRVCVYDRAGRGWSEPADSRQDGAQIATDLHTLLQRGHVPGPYVMAGHSFGGLYVLTFAARYPDEVAGLVLVDSTEPGSAAKAATSPGNVASYDIIGRASALLSASARLGLGRVLGVTPSHLQSTLNEYIRASASRNHAASLDDFADKPLVVLTAGNGSDAAWFAFQDDLATLSTNSIHRVIAGAAHIDLVRDQGAAAATSQGILDVVSSVRSAGPLVR
jgi:pimeloyl-ACP methyl ester carboxylesterase